MIVRPLKHRTQIERIAEQQICVSVADVELNRNFLPGGLNKSNVQKRVQERLVDEARRARSGGPPVFVERFFGLLAGPLPNVKPVL
jgi:hypothetical protein